MRVALIALLAACELEKELEIGSDDTGDLDADGFAADDDCNDADAAVNPGAPELCDGLDNDCDAAVDEDPADAPAWYADADGDGYGADALPDASCDAPAGAAAEAGDCDDADAAVNPGAAERSDDDIDEDCNGKIGAASAISATGDCQLDHYAARTDNETRLRIVGVYESALGDGQPVKVHVEPTDPLVLVLSAYSPVEWVVTEDVAGTIQRIIVNGYHAAAVTAPAGVPVEIHSYDVTGDYLASSSYAWLDSSTRELVDAVQGMTGLEVDSFHGCYSGSTITLESAAEIDTYPHLPNCTGGEVSPGPSAGPDPAAVSGIDSCASIVAESSYCMTTTGAQISLVGLDSGDTCSVLSTNAGNNSIAWLDNHLYYCGEYGALSRVDLATGAIESAYVYCESVAAWQGRLLIVPEHDAPYLDDSDTYIYDSFTDAQCLGPSDVLSKTPPGTRITAHGDTLYSAWHSTSVVWKDALPDIDGTGGIPLDGYDGWIYGLSVLDSGVLAVIANDNREYRLYDTTTHALLGILPFTGSSNGLSCVTN